MKQGECRGAAYISKDGICVYTRIDKTTHTELTADALHCQNLKERKKEGSPSEEAFVFSETVLF